MYIMQTCLTPHDTDDSPASPHTISFIQQKAQKLTFLLLIITLCALCRRAGHPVTVSSGHPLTVSSGHPVSRLSGHLVICLSVVTRFSSCAKIYNCFW